MGPIENDSKLRAVSWTQAAPLQELGIETHSEAKVLGGAAFYAFAVQEVNADSFEKQNRVVNRLGRLPIEQAIREELYRTRGVLYALGSFVSEDGTRRKPTNGSVSLMAKFAGHRADTTFFVQCEAVIAWLRAEHYWGAAGFLLSLGV